MQAHFLTLVQEVDKLVGDFVRYVLFMDRQKIPVKRDDINKVGCFIVSASVT